MKASVNNIEIPWGVTTLEVLIKDTKFKNKYMYHEEDDAELIKTFTDGFNYIKGQIVEISLTGFGKIPAIITNINDRDVNNHLTYDIVILFGGRNKSVIKSKDRYLWRFTEKADENTIDNFNKLIEIIFNPSYGYDEFFARDVELGTICYLSGTSIVSYNLNQINPKKPDIGRGLVRSEFMNFGPPNRGQTSSIVNVDECPFTEVKTLSELCGKEVDDNEHY